MIDVIHPNSPIALALARTRRLRGASALREVHRFWIPGKPPRKNRRHSLARGRLRNSSDFLRLVRHVSEIWGGRPTIREGVWRVEITAVWSSERHLHDVDVPYGDVDAPVSPAHDALEKAGVIDNDIRISELSVGRAYDADWPGLLIVLARIGGRREG